MSKRRYRVILVRKDQPVLTSGELSLKEARLKADYLSQYGSVSIMPVRDSEKEPAPQPATSPLTDEEIVART